MFQAVRKLHAEKGAEEGNLQRGGSLLNRGNQKMLHDIEIHV